MNQTAYATESTTLEREAVIRRIQKLMKMTHENGASLGEIETAAAKVRAATAANPATCHSHYSRPLCLNSAEGIRDQRFHPGQCAFE